MAAPSGADTRLRLDLKGRDPSDGTTDIAYEKGAAFLRTIELAVGRDRFDVWLKGWFERHQFQPVTTNLFLADLREHLIKGDAALEARLALDSWVDQPGIPANMAPADPAIFAEVDQAVTAFAAGGTPDRAAWDRWTTDERLRFMNGLPRKLSVDRLTQLETAFGLNRAGNNEVLFAWLDLATQNRYDPAVPALETFLTSLGRGKFVRPLYTTLYKDAQWGRPIAVRIFDRAAPLYHPLVRTSVTKIMAGSA